MTLQEIYKHCEPMDKPAYIRRKGWKHEKYDKRLIVHSLEEEKKERFSISIIFIDDEKLVYPWMPRWRDLIADDWEVVDANP